MAEPGFPSVGNLRRPASVILCTTPDGVRTANHVPALQEQLKQAERYTQEGGFGIEKDKAPGWLKEALERWEREDS